MRLLIAGCGWLGTALGASMARDGHRVVGIRRDPRAGVALRAAGIEPLIVDLARPGAGRQIPDDYDAIVASQSAGGPAAAAYRTAYVEINAKLIERIRARRQARLVVVGSTGVFGQADGSTVDETTATEPAGETGEILVEAEALLSRAAASGLHVSLVRASGLYGPERHGVIERVRSGRFGRGPGDETWTNWCHRDDAVRVLRAALEQGRPGAIYHASDATPIRRRDLAEWIAQRLGVPTPAAAGITAPGNRRGANRRIVAERTRAELGVQLAYPSVLDGLSEVLPG